MNIEERLSELSEAISALPELRRQTEQIGVLRTRLDQFERMREACGETYAQADLLREQGVRADLPWDAGIDSCIATLNSVLDSLEATPENLEKGFSFKEFEQILSAVLTNLQSQLLASWIDYLGGQAQPIDPNVLLTLGRIPAFEGTIAKIRKIQPQIAEARRQLPKAAGELADTRELISELSSTWGALGAETIPKDVLEFLRLSSTTGAPLSILSNEVLRWLEEQDLLQQFQILPTRTGMLSDG